MSFSFLPEKLDLNGAFEEIVSLLYSVFERDVKQHKIFYQSLPVVFDDRKIDSEYEEGFWHIITRGKSDERLLDFKRAKRIVWLRPLIHNSEHPELLKWLESDLDKKGQLVRKTCIWYKEGGYLIILKEIPRRYFLTTAFYVTGERNERYYLKKYSEAQKKRGLGD
jgi:hypothetical protein